MWQNHGRYQPVVDEPLGSYANVVYGGEISTCHGELWGMPSNMTHYLLHFCNVSSSPPVVKLEVLNITAFLGFVAVSHANKILEGIY